MMFGLISASEGTWDRRTFTMYLTDDEVTLLVDCYDKDSDTNLVKTGSGLFDYSLVTTYYHIHTYKAITLTMEEFTNDIAYYLVNYGLGITTEEVVGQSLDMRQIAQSSTEKDVDYSKLLTKFNFTEDTALYTYDGDNNITGTIIEGPAWEVGISLSELAGTDESTLGNLNATIYGDKYDETLGYINAKVSILSNVITATLNAEVVSFDQINVSSLNEVKAFIDTYTGDEHGVNKTTSNVKEEVSKDNY